MYITVTIKAAKKTSAISIEDNAKPKEAGFELKEIAIARFTINTFVWNTDREGGDQIP